VSLPQGCVPDLLQQGAANRLSQQSESKHLQVNANLQVVCCHVVQQSTTAAVVTAHHKQVPQAARRYRVQPWAVFTTTGRVSPKYHPAMLYNIMVYILYILYQIPWILSLGCLQSTTCMWSAAARTRDGVTG
jgi:hypothetical protein